MENLLITDRLKELYQSILVTGKDIPIEGRIVNSSFLNSNVAANCQIIDGEKIIIKIHEDYVREEIIFHELLHAKYTKQGYYNGISSTCPNSLIELLGDKAQSALIHKKLYDEMKRYGFNIDENWKEKCKSYIDNMSSQHNMLIALNFVYIKIIRPEDFDIFEDVIRKNYTEIYSYIIDIDSIVNNSDTSTPYKYRKSLISLLRYLEKNTIIDNMKIEFTKFICIGFIPSKYQLEQKVNQIFTIDKNLLGSGRTGLTTRSDKQLSILIEDTYADIGNLDLKLLLKTINHPCITRD